ncbi:MAG TPA: hypothetical protein DDX39_04405 [Bacteroidales bacterium]|nr:MAG: hypothetical protein A2W98_10595 [Bacteroidetes bacterium GWF2_33_38]OFY75486.1 MAG: hypothetical protein A2265_03360 [Bacteroidetes bacterium RIFOXYA12_FULL_33_9]OFY90527.1 MAG: hypothetical protein A2236_05570 [Bacteroidetes bacterium RIFOXYA2_FULL_33_7]HBF87865.1 hypothetical protein [Bacteroidales bacterium]
MKLQILSLLLYLIITTSYSFSQGFLNVDLSLKNIDGSPLSFTDIWLIENSTHDSLSYKTDLLGSVLFKLDKGKTWSLNYKEIRNHTTFTVPENGGSNHKLSLVYVPDEKNIEKIIEDRTNLSFEIINSNVSPSKLPENGKSVIRLKLISLNDKPLIKYDVALTCIKDKKQYVSKTDLYGEARFLVPNNRNYEVDVSNHIAYDYIKLDSERSMVLRKTVEFIPTEIVEKVSPDTIRQDSKEIYAPTSDRAFVTVNVRDFSGNPLENEDVFYQIEDSSLVFATVTNEKGTAKLLLPKGYRYILNFKYERGVKLFDNRNLRGMIQVEGNFAYRGSKQIEDYYDQSKRDKNGFFTEFMHIGIKPYSIDYDYLEKTENGFNLAMSDSSEVFSPAVVNDKIYIGSSFYNPELMCFDANTGQFSWGVSLQESGISSVVYDSDVLFVNTYSCTLYAIKASNGELLWSKWLGPVIYSTPSVFEGKVYSVYPAQLDYDSSKETNNFVLVCFSLKTGDILWQNWIDYEVLGAPVISENIVYLTTYSGALYSFDATNGSDISHKNIHAISTPTIVDNRIYINTFNQDNKTMLNIIDAKTLEIEKKIPSISKLWNTNIKSLSAASKMNYDENRIVHYHGFNYLTLGKRLICSDAETGEIVWSSNITNSENNKFNASTPVVVNGKIIICTSDGKIKLFDSQTGKIHKEYDTGNELWISPTVYNGAIYSGSKNGKMIKIDTKDKNNTGWNMWGGNSNHNAVQK